MTHTPDVSVIIAAFNAQYHIGRAIESSLAQRGVKIEVIVVDDASTDETCAQVEALSDPRVVLIRSKVNGGPSVARDTATRVARADWLAVLDADDAITEDRLTGLLTCAKQNGADIVADNMQVERDGVRSLFIQETLDNSVDKIDLPAYADSNILFSRGRSYGYLKPLIRAQFLRNHRIAYDPTLRIGEDFMLIAEMLAHGAVYARQRSAGYIYTVHGSSISHRLSAANAEAMAIADHRFIAKYEDILTAAGKGAMLRHQRGLEDGAAFTRMVSAIKARRWAKSSRSAAGTQQRCGTFPCHS